MGKQVKKIGVNLLRIGICAAALWLVARGVTYYDHVNLVDGAKIVGDVISVTADDLTFRQKSGETMVVPNDRVARDSGGLLKVDYGLRSAWRNSKGGLLMLALLIHFPVVFPQALRFQWLLRAQSIRLSYWESLKLSFAGNFLNFATPLGSHAGDAFKAYFASLHTDRKTEAVTTVVLDRMIGLGTLLLTAALITLFASREGKLAVLQPYVLGLLGAAIVGLLLYFSPLVRWRHQLEAWSKRAPAFVHVLRIDKAARTLAAHRRVLLTAILLTAFLQVLALSAYIIVASATGIQAGTANYFEFLAYFYTGTLVQALPGPPQGLGTVELTYRYFFSPYGSPSQIICMALAIRVVVLICALPGLLVTLTGGYRPKQIVEITGEKSLATPAVQEPII